MIAQQRLRMEGWRLRRLEIRLGSTERKHKAVLTQTGLLMEGVMNQRGSKDTRRGSKVALSTF
jgi:hypothetical protein